MTNLENQIRELKDSVEYWKNDSATAWDKCEERRQAAVKFISERNECVEEIRKLREALLEANKSILDANRNGFTRGIEALKLTNDALIKSPTIERLLKESK